MRKYLKIKNQTNVVTFATEEITHSQFSGSRLLFQTRSRKFTFPTVAGPALGVSLCEVESFDLNILRLYYSAILTQKNSLDK